MTPFIRSFFVVAASLGLSLSSPLLVRPAKAAPVEAPKFGVLVGITDYPQKGVAPLEGSLNDVREMKEKLVSDFGFPAKNIVSLTNAQARRGKIVKAVRAQLRDQARQHPSGTFLFYFSGYGAQTPASAGDKLASTRRAAQGGSETLVTSDVDLSQGDLDVLCREVRGVKNFSGSLTVILDTGHSFWPAHGVGEKGVPHVRSVPFDASRLASPLKVGSFVGAGHFTRFSACSEGQTEEERMFPVSSNPTGEVREQAHGALTFYLLGFMGSATHATTNRAMWTQLSGALSGRFDQTPPLEGDGAGEPFLGGAPGRNKAPDIPYSLAGTTLSFPRGIEAGAVEGGFVEVQSQGNIEAQLPISSARPGEASATVPAGLKIAPTGTVKLLTPFFGSEPLRVGFGPDIRADNPVVARLKRRYKDKDALVRIVEGGERAQADVFLLRSEGRPDSASGPVAKGPMVAGYIFAKAAGARPIFGAFLPAKTDGDIAEGDENQLLAIPENYLVQRNVKALSNRNQDDQPRTQAGAQAVKVTALRISDTAPVPIDMAHDKLRPGERIRLKFENQTALPLYVGALWLSDDGGTLALADDLAETDKDTEGKIKPEHKRFLLQPKGGAGDSAQTAIYTISGPAAHQTIQVFTSRTPLNLGTLERDTPDSPHSRAGIAIGDASPLSALADPATRSGTPGFNSWSTNGLSISIGDS